MLTAFLIGNLGADPEVRFAPSGQKITTLRVASNSKRQGKEETTWFRVTIFGDRFDKMIAYLKKGSLVVVTGELTTSLWTDKEGKQHIQNEIIADGLKFGPSNRSAERPQGEQSYGNAPSYSQPAQKSYASQMHAQPAPVAHEFSFEEAVHDQQAHGHGHDEPPF